MLQLHALSVRGGLSEQQQHTEEWLGRDWRRWLGSSLCNFEACRPAFARRAFRKLGGCCDYITGHRVLSSWFSGSREPWLLLLFCNHVVVAFEDPPLDSCNSGVMPLIILFPRLVSDLVFLEAGGESFKSRAIW